MLAHVYARRAKNLDALCQKQMMRLDDERGEITPGPMIGWA